MSELVRLSVSLDRQLADKFDRLVRRQKYPTRSKAVADLIRQALIAEEWQSDDEVVGAVVLVYDHHHRNLTTRLTDIQHDYHALIVATQHIHLDHHNCLEIVSVKGRAASIRELEHRLRTAKGVKFGALTAATTGRDVP